MDLEASTLLVALGSAGVFTFLGQLVQSYVTRKQGMDGAQVDLAGKKIGDAASFRQELQRRDTELNERIDELRAEIDQAQKLYHETNARCAILEEQNARLKEQNTLLKSENERLREERRNPSR